MEYVIYVADVETTGLDSRLHDIIELSLLRLNDGSQKTWHLKPSNKDTIDDVALKINGHKLDDLLHLTKAGRDRYLDPDKVIIEIENWLNEDNVPISNRILCGQNVSFDRDMCQQLWKKCNSEDTFPFGRRLIDTMCIEIFLDFCKGQMAAGYSLNNLVKKYGIKNEKAHSAEADVKATKEVFQKQVAFLKTLLNA